LVLPALFGLFGFTSMLEWGKGNYKAFTYEFVGLLEFVCNSISINGLFG
jgi:hypothetical protein